MKTSAAPGDQARVSLAVAVPPAAAFRIFTEEIDAWWRRGLEYRVAGRNHGILQIEPRVGGRLLESFDVGAETRIFQTGTVTVWDPPARLCFEWRTVNFAPAEKTEVEVTFQPTASGTLVTVTHRGWSAIRGDHPARHGLAVPAFVAMMGLWWGDLMSSLREHAEANTGP